MSKKNLKETINKIYLERKKIYNEADFRIKSSFLTIEEIVKKILENMKKYEIKIKNSNFEYSIIIGENILGDLKKRIKFLCPKTKKIAFIIDKKVPVKFKYS